MEKMTRFRKKLRPPQSGFGQRVGHCHREEKIDGRAGYRNQDRVAEAPQNLVGGKNEAVGVQRYVLWNKEHGPGGNLIFRGKGGADNIDKREDRCKGHQRQEEIVEGIENAAAHRGILSDRTGGNDGLLLRRNSLLRHDEFLLPQYSPCSPIIWAILLEPTTRVTLTMAFIRPMAEA